MALRKYTKTHAMKWIQQKLIDLDDNGIQILTQWLNILGFCPKFYVPSAYHQSTLSAKRRQNMRQKKKEVHITLTISIV